MAVPFILYAIGVQLFRIAATQAGKKVAARLVAGGAKKVTQKVATKMGGAPTTITARNVAGVLKNVRGAAGKQPKGGIVRPKGGSTKTTTKPQQGPGGVTIKPTPKPKPKPTPKPKPPKKDPKSPFAKRTAKEKAADAAKLKRQQEAMKKPNRATKTGRFDKKGSKITNVPKSGAKPKPMTRRGKLVRGGTAILTGTQLLDLKGDTPQPVTKKVTPKTGQGRPSAIPSNRKKTSGVRPNLDKNTNTKKEMTFGEKFDRSRNKDKVAVFDFKGKKYTTRLKEESIKDHKKKFGVTGKY